MTQYAYGPEEIDRLLEDAFALPGDPHDDGPTTHIEPSHMRSLCAAARDSVAPPDEDVHTMTTRRSPPVIIVDPDARMKRLTYAIWSLAGVLLMWLAWLVFTHS